ncbi:MAG: metallophosphoesterase [Haloarculaceae archaeon]
MATDRAAPSEAIGLDRAPDPALAAFERPRAEPTRLAVLADPHVTPDAEGTWKVYHRSEARLRAAIADVNRRTRGERARGVDAVVCAGDLTKDGTPAEFATVDPILDAAEPPVVAVPGNHDVPKPEWDDHDTPPPAEFARRYAADGLPFVERVGGVDLVGLDSAGHSSLSSSHEGLVGPAQRDWLAETLPALETPIVVLHHGVAHPREHTGPFPDAGFYQVRDADPLRGILARGGAGLVVSGHIHWPAIARLDGPREVIAPSVCSFPPSYLLVDVTPTGTTVRLVLLADRVGMVEAYAHARRGNDHGRGIARWADATIGGDLLVAAERLAATRYRVR